MTLREMLDISKQSLERLKSVEGTSPRLKRLLIREIKDDINYLKENEGYEKIRRKRG